VIRTGLVDKSARVRQAAADCTYLLRRQEFVPDLTSALAAETNPKVKNTILHSLRLLRDGYIIEPVSEDVLSITIPTKDGTIGRLVSATEFQAKGLNSIIAELQEPDIPRLRVRPRST
jgi:hypothetical protein